MKKRQFAMIAFLLSLALLACAGCAAKEDEGSAVPETHAIAYDETLDTLDDDMGADAYDHSLDHTDSAYYAINDFYNMESGGSLHILPHFETYQQTTEYSCGCASAVMVLNCFGNHDYN